MQECQSQIIWISLGLFYTQYTNDVKMYISEKATHFTSGHSNSFAVALLFALFGLTKHLIPFPV